MKSMSCIEACQKCAVACQHCSLLDGGDEEFQRLPQVLHRVRRPCEQCVRAMVRDMPVRVAAVRVVRAMPATGAPPSAASTTMSTARSARRRAADARGMPPDGDRRLNGRSLERHRGRRGTAVNAGRASGNRSSSDPGAGHRRILEDAAATSARLHVFPSPVAAPAPLGPRFRRLWRTSFRNLFSCRSGSPSPARLARCAHRAGRQFFSRRLHGIEAFGPRSGDGAGDARRTPPHFGLCFVAGRCGRDVASANGRHLRKRRRVHRLHQRPSRAPGQYRVIVFASEPTADRGGAAHRGLPRSLVPKRYNDPKSTPLRLTVAPSPLRLYHDFEVLSHAQ